MAIRASSRNLPTTAEIAAAGLGIEQAWRSLLKRLEPIAGGSALVVRRGGGTTLDSGIPLDKQSEMIRLLAFLIRPDDNYLDELRDRCGASETYAKNTRQLPDNVHKFSNPARLALFESFARGRAYRSFTRSFPDPDLEDYFTAVMSSAPGLTWFAGAFARCFSEHWSSVWISNDPENTEEGAFPIFVGFAKRDDDGRAAGHLLSASNPVFEGIPDQIEGNPYLALCAISDDDGRRPTEAVLALSNKQLEALEDWLGDFWYFGRRGIGRATEVLWFLSDHGSSLGDGPGAIRKLFEIIGDPARFSDLEKLEEEIHDEPRLAEDYRRHNKRQMVKQRVREEKARLEFLRRTAAGDAAGLWQVARDYDQLPLGESLFALFLSWHRKEALPDERPPLGGGGLPFLAWALEGRGRETLDWLSSIPHAEAESIVAEVVTTARRPFASRQMCGIVNIPLKIIKNALPDLAEEAGDD